MSLKYLLVIPAKQYIINLIFGTLIKYILAFITRSQLVEVQYK